MLTMTSELNRGVKGVGGKSWVEGVNELLLRSKVNLKVMFMENIRDKKNEKQVDYM